jgi:hypothetical protein
MSIDILYFPQKRFHIGCILMKLRYQSFNPIELQLRTEIFYKREPDKFIVNIGMRIFTSIERSGPFPIVGRVPILSIPL